MPYSEQTRFLKRTAITQKVLQQKHNEKPSEFPKNIDKPGSTEDQINDLLTSSINQSTLSEFAIHTLNSLDTLKCNHAINIRIRPRVLQNIPADSVEWLAFILRNLDQLARRETTLNLIAKSLADEHPQIKALISNIHQLTQRDITQLQSLGHHLVHYRHILFAERDPEVALLPLLNEAIRSSDIDNMTLLWMLNTMVFHENNASNKILMEKIQQLDLILQRIVRTSLHNRLEILKDQLNTYYQSLLPEPLGEKALSPETVRKIVLFVEFDIYTAHELATITPPQHWYSQTPSETNDLFNSGALQCLARLFCSDQSSNTSKKSPYFTFMPRLLKALKTIHEHNNEHLSPCKMIDFMKWMDNSVTNDDREKQKPLSLCRLAMQCESIIEKGHQQKPLDESSLYLLELLSAYDLPINSRHFEIVKVGNYYNYTPTQSLIYRLTHKNQSHSDEITIASWQQPY